MAVTGTNPSGGFVTTIVMAWQFVPGDMFPRLDYLEWIQGRREVALYDLGSSDLRGDRGHEPEAIPGPLQDLPDPPVGATVELQLAQQYGVNPEQVLVTPGATTANLLAAAAAVRLARQRDSEPADDAEVPSPRVLVEKPGYEPLVKTPRGVGAAVDRFLRNGEYALETDRVVAAMTPGTELVTVTNRHNPSGRLTDRETLAELAAAVREEDARLLVDEVYAPYVAGDTGAKDGVGGGDGDGDGDAGGGGEVDLGGDGAFGGITAAGLDGAVVTGSLTKFYGLGDVRIGWLIGDEEFVETARHIEHHIGGVAGPSRILARRALHNTDHLGAEARALLSENTQLLEEFATSRDDIRGTVEPGSSFAFLDPQGVSGDEVTEAAWDEGILVIPGRFFDEPERIRVSLGCNPETMAAGLDALGEVLDSLVEGDTRQTQA